MEKAKKIFGRTMTVLSVVIFVFGLVIFISVLNASAGKVPSVFGFSILQVRSGSMEPEYMTGSVVVVKKTDVNKLEIGDVISFYSMDDTISGKVNTHRIIRIDYMIDGDEPIFTTQGDRNELPDKEKVHATSVIGKVVCDLGTASGTVISVLQNPKVIFFVIILPLIFITFSEAINLVTLIAKHKYGQEEDDDEPHAEEKN
jgi:signal peptidase